jgi:putative DNA primase/helicase
LVVSSWFVKRVDLTRRQHHGRCTQSAKALGARWDAVKKAWYAGPEADREKISRWEPKLQPAPTLDPRAEFAAVLRELGGVVQGEHPIMNGESQRIAAVNDKRGELTIFYIAHEDGVPNGCAENNRTKQVIRWKADRATFESGS